MRHAKRRAFLAADDDFFGFQAVAARFDDAARRLFATLVARDASIERAAIYGELCGGVYAAHGVPSEASDVEPVQREIQYSPRVEFIAFDVRVERQGVEDDDDDEWLAPPEAFALLDESGFDWAR